MADVIIAGRDLVPCARLLEALTRAGLLGPSITWEDGLDKLVLHVPEEAAECFRQNRFEVRQAV